MKKLAMTTLALAALALNGCGLTFAAPTCVFTGPASGSVIASEVATTITFDATTDAELSEVRLFLDDDSKASWTADNGSYQYIWNPTGAASGAHLFSAEVTDVDGRVGTCQLPLTYQP